MSLLTTHADGGAPETEIALDLAKRGLWVAPGLVALCGLVWGVDGAISSAYAVAVVIANFLVSAALLGAASRISVGFVMGAAMFGYLIRLGLVAVAVLAVQNVGWFEVVPLGLTLIVTHLGLLIWETRFVSASLAHPGLKPHPAGLSSTKE